MDTDADAAAVAELLSDVLMAIEPLQPTAADQAVQQQDEGLPQPGAPEAGEPPAC